MSEVSKKRILLLSGWYYPDAVGGTEKYVQYLGRNLQSLGWEVFVAASSVDEKEHRYIHEGLSVYRYPVSLHPGKEELRGESAPQYLDTFINWVKALGPDIVHFHSRTRGCGFYHARSIKALGIPLVLTVHAADFMCVAKTARLWGMSPCDGRLDGYRCTACWLVSRGVHPRRLARLFSRMPDMFARRLGRIGTKLGTFFSVRKIFLQHFERDKIFLSYFSRIIVVAKWLYAVLKVNNAAEEKLYYCRHGISGQTLVHQGDNKPHAPGKIRVGFVGRFSPVKGIHTLIKAVRKIPQGIGIELKIYGRTNSNEEGDYLKKLMRLSHGDPRIEFCGELTDMNYTQALSGFDVLAVPSLWLETGPYIILEAFQAGIPVLGSNQGGIAELVTHNLNGMLINPGSVEEWLRALVWVYNHPDILNTWARNIPTLPSSREVAQEMDALYRQVLANTDKTAA
jgi:glycosyltransferase involved in cell wall biosynthesis